MLNALEAAALARENFDFLEKKLMLFLRWLMCGDACKKTREVLPSGQEVVRYKAFSNAAVRQKLRVHTIASELRYRRLRWLQSLLSTGEKGYTALAALHGFVMWESETPVDRDCFLSESAHPWIRLFYDCLQELSSLNRCFCEARQKQHWWSIYTDEFRSARSRAI